MAKGKCNYLSIRVLTKGYLLEWTEAGQYEYKAEAVMDLKEVKTRITELLTYQEED